MEMGLDSYFDINRRMRLSDKFDEERSTELLETVIDVLIQVSEKCDARLLIAQDCKEFISLVSKNHNDPS